MERFSCLKLVTVFLLYHSLKRSSCQPNLVYMGCYSQFQLSEKSAFAVQKATECVDACSSQLLHFIGLKDGMVCFCGNITYSRVTTTNCDLPCATGRHLCGGLDLYSVYSDAPVYVGCMLVTDKGMCASICSDRGLLFHYQQSGPCACATLNYEEQAANLSERCRGECLIDNTCTLIRIFSATFFPGLNKHYSEFFHCANEVMSPTGECAVQSCKPGWKGPRCEHRDCSVNNGDCGDFPCSTSSVGTQSISDCVCKKGLTFGLTTFERCTDIDECESNPCMESIEQCRNTLRSYMCVCAHKHEAIKCDSEPCSKHLFSCNDSSCQKYRGFYKCHVQKEKPLKYTEKPSKAGFAGDFDVRTIELVVYICVGAVACILTLMLTRKIRNKHAGKAQFGVQESTSSGVGGNVLQKGMHVEHDAE